MTDNNEYPADLALRIGVAIYLLNDVCRCHLYTNGTSKCVRCGLVEQIKEHWPNEWAASCCVYAEMTSREQKDGK